MSPILKRSLHGVGTLLAIAGIVFVTLRLRDQAAEIDLARFNGVVWLAVAGLALAYGLANLLLALAWRNLLDQFGIRASLRWAINAYGISQMAKYVPGNIVHLAGRQALGLAAGLPGWPLAKSTVWELGLIAVAGVLFGALALPLLVAGFPSLASLTLFLVATGGSIILLRRVFGPPVAHALGYYLIFLAISGALFVILIYLVDASTSQSEIILLPIIGAYVIAWLAGLMTPGAPAGVGVREIVMYALLHTFISQSDLLTAIVLARIVTVAGDLLFYLLALVFFKPSNFDKIKITESACD